MSARWSWQQVLKELRGAQSTLARADVKHRREGDEWHDLLVTKTRLALAEAVRNVRALRAGTAAKRTKHGRAA
jgi:hypothetical protein